MTEHPTPSIPPIDPAYIAEVKQLVKESRTLAGGVVHVARRVGVVMEKFDALHEAAGYTDEAYEELQEATGYRELMSFWYAIAGHATAAADHRAYMRQPDWYEQLIERRHARYAAEVA